MHLLYLCDADSGGIAEYALRQVRGLEAQGTEVTFLCRSSFDLQRVHASKIRAILPCRDTGTVSAPVRLLRRIRDARAVARITVLEAISGRFDGLLIACYAEYFSPFWAGIYRCIANKLPIGIIAHDPVRDYVLGPLWWHRWSVRKAYSFVSKVFVHDSTPVDFGGPQPTGIKLYVIPHGPYEVSAQKEGRTAVRRRLGFADNDQIFLSFGQIRDGKNLDRFLRVMTELPSHVKLLVAGSSGGTSLRQPQEYQQLARDLGVADRCVWDIRYVPDEETGDLFAAADFVIMTYSAKFHSASGVLNTAITCRKPVLASSGSGPLKTAVEEYQLGVFVPPDGDQAILEGARHLITESIKPDWKRYEQENSWEENAKRVIRAFCR